MTFMLITSKVKMNMKTTLPERSLIVKDRLDAIVKEILAVGKDRIAMIILFGSYARGSWVRDEYIEDHITYSFISDFDILLVVKKNKYAGYPGVKLRRRIRQRLNDKFSSGIMRLEPTVTLILESIEELNEQLAKGRYFYMDVQKDGILLYDSGEFTLVEGRELPWEERRPIAQDDYDQWFESGAGFFIGANMYLDMGNYRLAAFSLHQATESFYNAILLVFAGYKKKEHDILELGQEARIHHYELFKIFPLDTPEREKCFELLRDAYIKARYDKKYEITKEQLLYLIERVEKLKGLTEKICLEKIGKI